MFDLNSPIGNFSTFLKNYTDIVLFGITCTGKFFTLPPETTMAANPIGNASIMNNVGGDPGMGMCTGLFVLTCGKQSNTLMYPQAIEGRWYKTPGDNEPVYVEELNCVIFASEKERFDVYEKYGDASKMTRSYAANCVPLINSSYIAVTCLNRDIQFYIAHDRTIDPLPIETELSARDLQKKYGLTEEMLETHYVFIVNTIIRNSGKSRQTKDTKQATEIKRVEKSSIRRGEPIIFANLGVVLFESYEQGSDFLDKYGLLSNYLIDVALEATHDTHQAEIDKLNELAAKDKRGIVETYGVIGGTSAVSLLVENVIKTSMSDDKEASKKSIKTLVIGAIGIGTVVAAYKTYRWWEKKREEAKSRK